MPLKVLGLVTSRLAGLAVGYLLPVQKEARLPFRPGKDSRDFIDGWTGRRLTRAKAIVAEAVISRLSYREPEKGSLCPAEDNQSHIAVAPRRLKTSHFPKIDCAF